jgi:hypothetical protein
LNKTALYVFQASGQANCHFEVTTGNGNAVSRFLTAKAGPLTVESLLRGAAGEALSTMFCRQTELCREPSLVPTAHICRVDYVAHGKLICKQISTTKKNEVENKSGT